MTQKKTAAWWNPMSWGEAIGNAIYDNFIADADGLLLLKSDQQAKDFNNGITAINNNAELTDEQKQRAKDEFVSKFNKENLQRWRDRTERIKSRNKNLSYAQLFVDGFNPIGAFVDHGITPEQKAAMYSYYGVDPTWAMTWNMAGNVAQMATTGLIGKGLQATKLLKPAAWAAEKGMALAKHIPGVKKTTDFINAAGKFVNNKYGQGVNWLLSKTTPGGKASKFVRGTSNFVGRAATNASSAFAPLMGAYAADKTLTELALNYDANSWQHKWLAGSADVFNKAVGFRPMLGAAGASRYNIMNMMASPAMQRAAQNDLTRNSTKQNLVMVHRGKHDLARSMNATLAAVRRLESGDIKAALLQNTLDPVVSQYIKAYAALSKMTLEELRNKLADSGYALKFRALMIPALKQASSSEARQLQMQQKVQDAKHFTDQYLFMLRHGRQDPSMSATLAGITTLGITNSLYSRGVQAAQRLAKLKQANSNLYSAYKSATRIPRHFFRATKWLDIANNAALYAGTGIHKLPQLIYDKLYLQLTPLLRKVMDKLMSIPNVPQSLDLSDNIQDLLTIGPSRSLAAADRHAVLRPYYSNRPDDYASPSSRFDAVLRGKLRLALLKQELPKITDPEAREKAMRLYRMLQAGIYAAGKLLLLTDRANPVHGSSPYTYTPLQKSGLTAGILNELVSIADNPQNTPMRADNFYTYSNKLMDLLYTTAKSPADAVFLLLNAPDMFGLSETRNLLGDLIPVFKAYIDGIMRRLTQDSSMTKNQKLKLLNKVLYYIMNSAKSASPIMRNKMRATALSLFDTAYNIKDGEL